MQAMSFINKRRLSEKVFVGMFVEMDRFYMIFYLSLYGDLQQS